MNKIIIDVASNGVEAYINGEEYFLLCEYENRQNDFERIWLNENSKKVISESFFDGKAVVDLFSVESKKIPILFKYMEGTMDKDDFTVVAHEVLSKYLNIAKENGYNFLHISKALANMNDKDISFFSNLVLKLKGQEKLSTEFIKKIEEHTISSKKDISIENITINEKLSNTSVAKDIEIDMSDFKDNSDIYISNINISELMRKVESNAWYGSDPRSAFIYAGEDVIKIHGYTYEPIYEDFSATSSISLNDHILFGKDDRNVAPYRNVTVDIGEYDDLNKAVEFLQEYTKGKKLILSFEKKHCLDETIKQAATNKKQILSAEPHKNNEIVK